jgi:hypothetical protein
MGVSVSVGNLDDQISRPVVLPNKPAGAVCRLLVNVLLLNMCLFKNNTYGSCTTSFSPQRRTSPEPDLVVNSGQDTEAHSTDMHSPLNLVLWIFGCGGT